MAYNPISLGSQSQTLSQAVTLAMDNNGPVKIYDGTNTAGVSGAVGTTASGTSTAESSGVITSYTTKSFAFTFTGSTAGTFWDVANFASVKVQINTQYTTSTLYFAASNDAVNFYSQALMIWNSGTTSPVASTTSGSVGYSGPISGRYFKLYVTGVNSNAGTVAGTVTFSTAPYNSLSMGVQSYSSISGFTSSNSTSVGALGSIATSSSVSGYAFYNVLVSGTYSLAFTITASPDAGVTYTNIPVYDQTNSRWFAPGAVISPNAANASQNYLVPSFPSSASVRVTVATYTSGTATIKFSTQGSAVPYVPTTLYDAPNNATLPSNVVSSGGVAQASLPTATTIGNIVPRLHDKFGREVVLLNAMRDLVTTVNVSFSTTTGVIIAAAASIFYDLSSLVIANTSTTGTTVTIQDGATNRLTFFVPGGETRGITYATPLPQAAVNTAWNVSISSAVTSIVVSASFIQNK